MNSKMTTNSQLSTTEPKTKTKKQTKQTTRTGTESQKWRSYRGLTMGSGGGERGKRYREQEAQLVGRKLLNESKSH